ncbi:MAG: hypothetical protein EU536_04490 [Promethearchaeota archaeon]|nr:MAG: hypothetical protein EU536_04490 [Candidatus Lokiarchaeota archaeon]
MSKIDIEELIRILPKLIRENDAVKGAIITALSGVVTTKDDLKMLIEAMDKRFEAMDKRFEVMQEHIDKRFEAMDKRFEVMQEHIDKRFEAMDKRFEVMQEHIDKRFEAMENRYEDLSTSIKILTLSVARIESKEGILFQNTVLELMKDTLTLEKIAPEKIRKEILRDPLGEIFYPSYTTDIDVLVENDNTYMIEVKSTTASQDISHFLQNAKLFKKITGKIPTQLILITLRINQATYNLARTQGIRVIAGEIS